MKVSNLDVVEVLTAAQMIKSQLETYILPLAEKQGSVSDFYTKIIREVVADAHKIEHEVERARKEMGA